MALVKNNDRRLISLGGDAALIPGINSVPDDVWKKAQEVQVIKYLLSSKLLEEVSGQQSGPVNNAAGGPSAPAQELSGMSEEDALLIVGGTFDRALLQKWQEADSRQKVKDAIQQQINAVALTPDELATATATVPGEGVAESHTTHRKRGR